jgi:hypothetical protein
MGPFLERQYVNLPTMHGVTSSFDAVLGPPLFAVMQGSVCCLSAAWQVIGTLARVVALLVLSRNLTLSTYPRMSHRGCKSPRKSRKTPVEYQPSPRWIPTLSA